MNPQQDDFQQLRQLLALKKYEQPPPGYFDNFSRQVIVRIRAGESIERFSFGAFLSWEAPWLQRLWAALETKPIVAGAFGLAICGLLMAGMLYSEPRESALLPSNSAFATVPGLDQHPDSQMSSAPANPLFERVLASPLSGLQGVAPVPANDSLFQQIKAAQRGQADLISTSVGH